jgi:hypothetical protein
VNHTSVLGKQHHDGVVFTAPFDDLSSNGKGSRPVPMKNQRETRV